MKCREPLIGPREEAYCVWSGWQVGVGRYFGSWFKSIAHPGREDVVMEL